MWRALEFQIVVDRNPDSAFVEALRAHQAEDGTLVAYRGISLIDRNNAIGTLCSRHHTLKVEHRPLPGRQ